MCLRAVYLTHPYACGRYRCAVSQTLLHHGVCQALCNVFCLCPGYDAYNGYYQDGTAYAYDPSAYTAEAASTDPSGVPAAATAAGQTIAANFLSADSAVSQAPAALADDVQPELEPIAGLLTVGERVHLEQQEVEADIARKEAEERLRKAEEQRANAKVL